MRVRVLGDLLVEGPGGRADLGGPKPRALLGLLVAAEGRPVSVERLVDQVWGEDPPPRVQASLQSYVARLRRALEPDRDSGDTAHLLLTGAGGYSLAVPADAVDARRFVDAVGRAAPLVGRSPDDAVVILSEALGWWEGPAYAGLEAPALEAEAVRLEELRLGALADLWQVRVARGEHQAAVPELEQLVRSYPLRERLWALLARALYSDARQGDALAALRRARDHLAESLGVDPGVELRELETAILRHDPELGVRAATPVVTIPPQVGPRRRRTALVGRDDLFAQVDDVLVEAAEGIGRVILVSGEAGIGKSRFADEVCARAEERGFRTGRGTWEAEPCPPLWAWSRALEAATGGSAALESTGADATSVTFRQAQAVLATLAQAPTLLVLDDVHWADAESLRLLVRVAAGLGEVPAVVVAAVRDTADELTGPVSEALGGLARSAPVRLELSGLAPADVADWMAGRTRGAVGPSVVTELAERTDGNPLYLVELVRFLESVDALDDPGSPAWKEVPRGVRDVVRHRLAKLPEAWTRVLVTAATVGREFDLALVEQVHGGDDQTVADALEAAQLRGIVDESGPGTYRFTHALVRDALYETLPAPSRSRLHAAVGAAGETVYAGRIAEHAAELADHYRQAGRSYARSGWVLARTAAARAGEAAAHHEAVRWNTVASRLQRDDPAVEPAEREGVLVALARSLIRVAHPVEAWSPAEEAARSALARGRPDLAAQALLTVTEGFVWGWRYTTSWDDDGIALWRELLAAHPEPTLRRARLAGALAWELMYCPGAAAESAKLADEAVELVRRAGDDSRDALVVLRLAHVAMLRPDLVHHRVPLGDRCVELAAGVGDHVTLAAALTARAQDRVEVGRLDDAWSDINRAFEVAGRHELPEALVVAELSAASYRLATGDRDGAAATLARIEDLQRGLTMASRGIEFAHLTMQRDADGRLHEVEPLLRGARHYHPAVRELHTLAVAHTGDTHQLALALGPWADQPALNHDYSWLLLMGVRAEVWAIVGDRDAAGDLYAELTPYADRLAATMAMGVRGSVRHWLGRLATVIGDRPAAREHLTAAVALHERLGLPLWAERSRSALELVD